jgi:hypothetical protein
MSDPDTSQPEQKDLAQAIKPSKRPFECSSLVRSVNKSKRPFSLKLPSGQHKVLLPAGMIVSNPSGSCGSLRVHTSKKGSAM